MPDHMPSRVRIVAERKPGGVRWLTQPDPATASAYAAAVAPLVPTIERALPPAVVANRVSRVRTDPPAIRLESWRPARARFGRLVRDGSRGAGAAVMTDVRDCYASIGRSEVASALGALGVSQESGAPILTMLERFADLGVRGLPIGPEPSAVLANAVLTTADRALTAAGFAFLRWVDDIIVFTDDAMSATRALRVLEAALATTGLELAPEKTRILLDPASIRGGGPIRVSGRGGPPASG